MMNDDEDDYDNDHEDGYCVIEDIVLKKFLKHW